MRLLIYVRNGRMKFRRVYSYANYSREDLIASYGMTWKMIEELDLVLERWHEYKPETIARIGDAWERSVS